jgi:hypothetical protein
MRLLQKQTEIKKQKASKTKQKQRRKTKTQLMSGWTLLRELFRRRSGRLMRGSNGYIEFY